MKLESPSYTNYYGFLVPDDHIADLKEKIEEIKTTKRPILIIGEEGTGKQTLALSLHKALTKPNKPFIPYDFDLCSENQINRELFGWQKIERTREKVITKGMVDKANNGSIFFKNIDQIKIKYLDSYTKLIKDNQYFRVGGQRSIKANCFFINSIEFPPKDLYEISDQYYILEEIPFVNIELAPLRERPTDFFIHLSDYMNHSQKAKNKLIEIENDAYSWICNYQWPGNIEECHQMIKYLFKNAENNSITMQGINGYLDLQNASMNSPNGEYSENLSREDMIMVPVGISIQEAEKKLIKATLKSLGNNRSKTAKMLGISLRTLYRKINQYKLRDV